MSIIIFPPKENATNKTSLKLAPGYDREEDAVANEYLYSE